MVPTVDEVQKLKLYATLRKDEAGERNIHVEQGVFAANNEEFLTYLQNHGMWVKSQWFVFSYETMVWSAVAVSINLAAQG